MDVEQTQLEKARIFAYWGYIGFAIPVAGIISAAVSISILDRLVVDESDEDTRSEHARIKSNANVARTISIVLLIAMIIGTIVGITKVVELQNNSPINEYYQRVLDAADEN